jgi:ABC-type transport system involved in cytochrome bd biosynthesis fused ATPase/permease subunit
MAFSAIADAANAVERLYGVFEAEVIMEAPTRDPSLPVAIEVKEASFTWDSPPLEQQAKKKQKDLRRTSAKSATTVESDEKTLQTEKEQQPPFKIDNVSFDIPRGILLAIVGPVGTGKTSLLQGLIGEMRKTEGTVKFGGSVAYCAQSAWIQVCRLAPSALHQMRIFFDRMLLSEKTSALVELLKRRKSVQYFAYRGFMIHKGGHSTGMQYAAHAWSLI